MHFSVCKIIFCDSFGSNFSGPSATAKFCRLPVLVSCRQDGLHTGTVEISSPQGDLLIRTMLCSLGADELDHSGAGVTTLRRQLSRDWSMGGA